MPTYEKALEMALKWLKSRDYFQEEVRRRLIQRDCPPEVAEEVLKFLLNRRLLDDQRTIEALIAQNSGKRAIGIEKLRAKLIERGAPEDIVARELDSREEANLDLVMREKFPSDSPRPKVARFMLSRGFDLDSIESAMDRYLVGAGDKG